MIPPKFLKFARGYEEHRDRITSMTYKCGATVGGYMYDNLVRPITQPTVRQCSTVNDSFTYNSLWDPTQPTATRPLAIRKDGTWYAYGWDLTKNVTEIFGKAGYLRTAYTYTPYGEATATGDVTQPITWSSEYADEELALIYYNYRHYNPTDGRWINRDPIEYEDGWNVYTFVGDNPSTTIDILGLWCFQKQDPSMKKVIEQSAAGLLISSDYGLSSDYKVCCVSCPNGSQGMEVTGSISFSMALMAEMATYSFYAKKSFDLSIFSATLEGRFWGGVRIYGSISVARYLNLLIHLVKIEN